jgi:hypothetical protein
MSLEIIAYIIMVGLIGFHIEKYVLLHNHIK